MTPSPTETIKSRVTDLTGVPLRSLTDSRTGSGQSRETERMALSAFGSHI